MWSIILSDCSLLNLKKLKYLSVIILVSAISCNPVRQVLRDQVKFDQVAEEVIRRGYCANDTTVITELKDTVIYKDSLVTVIDSVPCRDFDTTIRGARISVRSGVLTYAAKDSIVYQTKTITNSIRDKALENILKADIASRDRQVDSLKSAVRNSQTANKELKADLRWMTLKFWILFAAALIIIFRKQLLRLVGGFI